MFPLFFQLSFPFSLFWQVDGAALRSLVYFAAVYGVTLAVAVWVFRDARERGFRYPALWGVGTVLFTILAVLPYLYLRLRSERRAAEKDAESEAAE